MQLTLPSISSDKRIERAAFTIGSIAVAVTLVKTTLRLIKSKNAGYNLPMVPYIFPLVGSTFDYYSNPIEFIKANTEKLGSAFRMHFHGEVTTVLGAIDAPEVFKNPHFSFLASKKRFFRSGIFKTPGTYTLPRNALTGAITKHLNPNLKDYSPRAFQQCLLEMQGRELENDFTVPDLFPFCRRLVSRSSASAFVGVRLCQDEDLLSAFEHAVTDIGTEFHPGPFRYFFPRLDRFYMKYFFPKSQAIQKYRTLIKASLSREIAQRSIDESQDDYAQEESKDLLDYLLKEYPHEIDDDHLESLTTNVLLAIFVGVHTTYYLVTYVMYSLAKYPEYIKELRLEQEQVVTEQGVDFSGQDVIYTTTMYRNMVKLDSFIRECLRTRMEGIGLAHTHIGKENIVLKSGAVIEPGQEVFVNVYHLHHDEETQKGLDNLEAFDGFRFVGNDKLAVKSGIDNLAFGMGRHACPGRWFAVHETKGIVSYFIKNYDFSAKSEIKMMSSTTRNHVGESSGSIQFTKI